MIQAVRVAGIPNPFTGKHLQTVPKHTTSSSSQDEDSTNERSDHIGGRAINTKPDPAQLLHRHSHGCALSGSLIRCASKLVLLVNTPRYTRLDFCNTGR